MFALPISIPCFKSIIFFYQNSPKIKLFLQKMQKYRALGAPPPHHRASGGWGLCPLTPFLRWLRALPPDPQNSPPFRILATHLFFNSSVLRANPTYKYPNLLFEYYLHLPQHTFARATFQLLCISKTKARNQRKVEYEIRLALSSTKPRICKLALWLPRLPSH